MFWTELYFGIKVVVGGILVIGFMVAGAVALVQHIRETSRDKNGGI